MKERILYLALCLAYLVPVWTVEYLPTTDGPAHTYNAWIVRQHGNPDYPLFDRYYEVDARPLPNWLGHAAMAGLMTAVPPRASEKLLVSGYLLLFLAGARFLARSVDPAHGWLAFLAFPLAYNQLFQMGFYNFCLGLAFFLFTVGVWWRRRAASGPSLVLALHGLLLLTWFSHLVAHFLALVAIAGLSLGGPRRDGALRGRWSPACLAILIPQAALPLWFLTGREIDLAWISREAATVWGYFLRLGVVSSFQLRTGTALAFAFMVLLALTLRSRLRRRDGGRSLELRPGDAFLFLGLLFAVLYFVSPDEAAGGSLIKPRLALFAWLVLIPGLAPDLEARGRNMAVGALAALALIHVAVLTRGYREADHQVRELLAGTARIAPDTRVLPLLFERDASRELLAHSFSYTALEKGLVNWDNYEAAADYFPVRFRPGAVRPDTGVVETRPSDLDVEIYRNEIDYIYCWKMRPGSEIARRIEEHYALVAEHGPARLYARKGWRPAAPAETAVARLED
jgi:hypothetical protein